MAHRVWLDQRIQCSTHCVGKGFDVLHDVHQLDYHEKSITMTIETQIFTKLIIIIINNK